MNTKPTLGWQCPCCSTIYSPAVMSCACQKPESKQPVDPHDNLREVQKRWEELMKKAQEERAKNPLPPLQYGLPLPAQPFDLEPVCTIPKYTRREEERDAVQWYIKEVVRNASRRPSPRPFDEVAVTPH